MRKRVNTLMEEEVIKQAKRLAAEQGRSLSDVIHDALVLYLSTKVPEHKERLKAYRFFWEQPIRIKKRQFKKILKIDAWE